MTRSEIAVKKFREGYNCAQSVLFSYADRLNIPGDLALRLATGFGGGMARKQEVCGALTGGILVINFLYGRGENEDIRKLELTYAKVRELIDMFEARYTTIKCILLLDGNVLLPPGEQKPSGSAKLKEKCCEYIEYTVKILDSITNQDDNG